MEQLEKIDELNLQYHKLAADFYQFRQMIIPQVSFFRTALLALDAIEDDGTGTGNVKLTEDLIHILETKGVQIQRPPQTNMLPLIKKQTNSKKSFPQPNKN